MSPITLDRPTTKKRTYSTLDFEPMYQVILYNDEIHTQEEVAHDLMTIFGHTLEIAAKIMKEANDLGKAVAEVEDHEKALLHKEQLQSLKYTVEIEKIEL